MIPTKSEEHVDWLEQQLFLIKDVALPNYLHTQIGQEEVEG
jgi:bacterioferritin (cytochrome b1)